MVYVIFSTHLQGGITVGKKGIVKGIIIDSGGIARTTQFNHADVHNYVFPSNTEPLVLFQQH
jgi:hypothetical protein